MLRNLQRRFGEIFLRHLVGLVLASRRFAPAVIVVSLAVAAALTTWVLPTIKINTDTKDMLSAELRFRQLDRELDEAFPQEGGTIAIVVDAATPERAEWAARRLAEQLRRMPDVIRKVEDTADEAFFRRNGLLYLNEERLLDMADRIAQAQPLLAAVAADPSLRGLFDILGLALQEAAAGEGFVGDLPTAMNRMSGVIEARAAGGTAELSWRGLLDTGEPALQDRRHFLVATVIADWGSLAPAAPAMQAIRGAVEQLGLEEGPGEVRVRLTGGLALDTEELQSVFEGATLASGLSFVLVALLLIVGLGSLRLVFAVLVTLVVGLICTGAFAAFAIGSLNLLSVAFAVLFIGLAVDFGIHFSLRVREERDSGHAVSEALAGATTGVGGALSLCAVAAAIGFYAFLPTDYRGLAELGLISGTSMIIALSLNLTLLPALIAVLPPKPRQRRQGSAQRGVEGAVVRHHKAIVLCAGAAGLAALAAAPGVHFNFDPLSLKDPTTESVQTALELRSDPQSTTLTVAVLTSGLDEAARLAARLETLPAVHHVVTPASFVPESQEMKLAAIQDMGLILMPVVSPQTVTAEPTDAERRSALHEFRERLERLVETDALADPLHSAIRRMHGALEAFADKRGEESEALRSLEEALVGLLPPMLSQLDEALDAEPVTLSDVPDSVLGRYIAGDGRVRIDVHPSENLNDIRELRKFVEAVRHVAPNATDSPVTLVEAGDAVIAAILQAFALALASIVVLLLVILGRPVDVLLVLFPLFLAGTWTLAVSALLDLPFNFANVIVLPLLLGLGVASGIHLVMRGRAGRRADAEDQSLLRTTTPRAVVFSALTTIGSFGSLAVSSHRGTASMGELLMIALGCTLIAALVVLPALLTWLDKAATATAGRVEE